MPPEIESTGIEQSSSDVSQESSSETQTSQAAEPSAESTQKAESQTPFHEHPRFKELIQEKNNLTERLKTYEKRFEEYDNRFKSFDQNKATQEQQARQNQDAKLLERLKGIDPEFGNAFEQIVKRAQAVEALQQELQDLRSWKDQTTTQSTTQKIASELERLHTENKVPKEWQDDYKLRIKAMAAENPNLGPADLPKVYAEVHAIMSKKIDALRRQDRASYVADKKASSTPSTPRGPAPKPAGSKPDYSKDPEQARGQLVQKIMKELRSQKQDI